ncbi:MAG: hypothetical protein ABIC95_06385 [archaeon]
MVSIDKKGTESVEVWMWVIAGMVIGSLIFVGGFKLLTNYVQSAESNQANENVNMLYSMITQVCFGGRGEREIDSLRFPSMIEKIYIEDEEGIENLGKNLCYDPVDDTPNCMDLKACTVMMNSISTKEKRGVFYAVEKFLGKRRPQQFRFRVQKKSVDVVEVNWTRELLKD